MAKGMIVFTDDGDGDVIVTIEFDPPLGDSDNGEMTHAQSTTIDVAQSLGFVSDMDFGDEEQDQGDMN